MSLKDKLEELAEVDLAIALGLGSGLSVLVVLDEVGLVEVSGDTLAKLCIPLVVAIGLALFQERRSRKRLATGLAELSVSIGELVSVVQNSLSELDTKMETAIGEALSSAPYHNIRLRATWDIESREKAVYSRTKMIRFTRDGNLAISEGSHTDATSESWTILGREAGSQYSFLLERAGRPYEGSQDRSMWVVPLNRSWDRGEALEITTTRELVGAFPNDSGESITIGFDRPTDDCVVEVRWPANAPPTSLRLYRTWGERKLDVTFDISTLGRHGARAVLFHRIDRPEVGELITLSWTW